MAVIFNSAPREIGRQSVRAYCFVASSMAGDSFIAAAASAALAAAASVAATAASVAAAAASVAAADRALDRD